MTKEKAIDLTLLKKLVGELEVSIQAAEGIKTSIELDKTEYIVEMSKAAGLCAGVMQEAGMLISDLQSATIAVQSGGTPAKTDFLDKILGPLKGGGSN